VLPAAVLKSTPMNLQGRNLSSSVQGPDVALLQGELAQLGYTIPTTETVRPWTFGPGTLQAVQDFQRKRGLVVTGVVDPATARKINAAIEAIVPPRFSVTGQVKHQDGTALSGLTVRAFDKDMRGKPTPLGNPDTPVVTDAAGRYLIAYTRDQFR